MNYTPDLITTSLKMLMSLVIVLGIILAGFYFSRRFIKRKAGDSKEKMIRVLANSYIGVKKSISLVEVPGVILVLGITSDNICLLSKIEDKDILNKITIPEKEKITSSFSDHLRKLMRSD